PAARQLPRRRRAARPLVLAVHPEQLARRAVERDHRAARARRGIDDALDHQRRGFELIFRPRTEAVGLEPPRDLELAEVVGVDLIERRVPHMTEIAAVAAPFALRGAG